MPLKRRWNAARFAASVTFLVLLATGLGHAQDTGAPGTVPAPTAPGSDSLSVSPDTGLAAAARLGASTADRVAEIRANFTPENRRYARTRQALGFGSPLYDIAISLLILFTGLSARIQDVAHRVSRRLYPATIIYLLLYTVVAFVLGFPLAWYSGYHLEHQYHLSNQTFLQWLGEQGKDALIAFVAFGLTGLMALVYLIIRKSPRRWWLWVSLVIVPVVTIFTLLTPLVIDPLYNKFVPLQDQALKAKIIALAEKAGIPGRNVYQVDKSKQTKKYNAYVSGFGASQRIVLWDTTLQGMREDEILFVMGHEMGHYKLHHIWKGIAFTGVLSVVLLFFSWWITNWAVRRWGPRWGFTELGDLASWPLIGVAITIVSLIVQPATNTFNRYIEHEADIFGVEVTQLNDAGARAFIKLGSQNKSDPEPSPIVKAFQYTHPPLIERVRFAMEYRPWEKGEKNRAYQPPGGGGKTAP